MSEEWMNEKEIKINSIEFIIYKLGQYLKLLQ